MTKKPPTAVDVKAHANENQEPSTDASVEALEAIAGPKGTESARPESGEASKDLVREDADPPPPPEHPLDERDTAIPRPIVVTAAGEDVLRETEDLPPAPEQPLDERETAIPRPIVSVNGHDVEKPAAEEGQKRSA